MVEQFKLPKGPSNSAGMGATPGTQQTAINNVKAAGLNPNMPFQPQLQRQQASNFQRSLAPAAPKPIQKPPMPVPKPAPRSAPTRQDVRQRPVVSQALPLDQGRGYNIFSGMDAGQISGMNQSMGLSNMTSLPPLTPQQTLTQYGPQFDTNIPQGRQFSSQLMAQTTTIQDEEGNYYKMDAEGNLVKYEPGKDYSEPGSEKTYGEGYEPSENYVGTDEYGIKYEYNPETGKWSKSKSTEAGVESYSNVSDKDVPDEIKEQSPEYQSKTEGEKVTSIGDPEDYGTDDKGNQTYTDENGTVWVWYEETGYWGKQGPTGPGKIPMEEFGVDEGEVPEEALAMKYQDMQGGSPDFSELSGKEIMDYALQQNAREAIGFDPETLAALTESLESGYDELGDDLGEQYEEVIEDLEYQLEEQKEELDAQYEEAKSNIDQQYAYQVDDMLADLDRQAAMMGTFGSGAHSANINDVIASSLANMADDYAAIDVQYAQDIKQLGSQYSSAIQQLGGQEAGGIQQLGGQELGGTQTIGLGAEEVDYQQNFANALTAAGYDDNQVNQAIQNAALIDQNLVSSVSGLIESQLGDSPSAGILYEMLGKATTGLYLSAYDDPEEQAWAIEQVEAVIGLIDAMAKVEAGQISPEEAQSVFDNIVGELGNSMNPFADDTNIFTDLLVSAIPGIGPIINTVKLGKKLWDGAKDLFGW